MGIRPVGSGGRLNSMLTAVSDIAPTRSDAFKIKDLAQSRILNIKHFKTVNYINPA
jgi:hypothetical protein